MTSSSLNYRPSPNPSHIHVSARHFWVGIAVLTIAIALHAAFPRYEWRQDRDVPVVWTRIDRWTGTVQLGAIQRGGQWLAVNEPGFKRPPTP